MIYMGKTILWYPWGGEWKERGNSNQLHTWCLETRIHEPQPVEFAKGTKHIFGFRPRSLSRCIGLFWMQSFSLLVGFWQEGRNPFSLLGVLPPFGNTPREGRYLCRKLCPCGAVFKNSKGVIRAKRKPPFFMPTRYVNPPKCRGFEGARVLNKVSKSLPTFNLSNVYPYRGRIFYDLPQNRVGGRCSRSQIRMKKHVRFAGVTTAMQGEERLIFGDAYPPSCSSWLCPTRSRG